MILVTLGTQKQQFTRILDAIENSSIEDEIIVQAGHTKYESKKMKIFDFISYDQMEKLVNKADCIITHGGTGSIVEPLKKGKKIIACARLQKYGEHVDDHQEELVSIFSDQGYILELKDGQELNNVMKQAESFTPNKYESNTENFICNLKSNIDKKYRNNTKISSKISLMFFVLFLVISIFVPLTGDDWTNANFGTNNLFKIIKVAYDKYFIHEGRFFSRIFVIFFTNTKWLWNLIVAISIAGIYNMICKITNSTKKIISPILIAFSLILLENTMFTQTYLWITGYATYLLPLFFTLIYLYLVDKIWKNENVNGKIKILVTIILNIIISMMVENISASLVVINILILIYRWIKTKKIDKVFLINLIISVAGATAMLLSPGAKARLQTDNADFAKLSIIGKIFKNFPNLIQWTYINNAFLLFIMVIVLGLIIHYKYRNKFTKISAYVFLSFPLITAFVTTLSTLSKGINSSKLKFVLKYIDWTINGSNIGVIVYWSLFTIFFVYMIIRYSDNKFKTTFYMLVAFSSNIAMLLSPIWGGRTAAFTVYFLYITLYLVFNEIQIYEQSTSKIVLILKILVCILTVLVIIMLIAYYNVNLLQKDRENIIEYQIKQNKTDLVYPLFPEYLLHNANAWNEFHQNSFKKYYGINENTNLIRIKKTWKFGIKYVRN